MKILYSHSLLCFCGIPPWTGTGNMHWPAYTCLCTHPSGRDKSEFAQAFPEQTRIPCPLTHQCTLLNFSLVHSVDPLCQTSIFPLQFWQNEPGESIFCFFRRKIISGSLWKQCVLSIMLHCMCNKPYGNHFPVRIDFCHSTYILWPGFSP